MLRQPRQKWANVPLPSTWRYRPWYGNCSQNKAVLHRPRTQRAASRKKETAMRNATNGTLVAALIVSLSGAAYAQGAGAGGGGGGTAGGNEAGQGGTRMGTPNAAGTTDTMSGASGANTMGTSPSSSQKMQKQKSGEMESPAS